jgi:hypothetical protein
MDWIDLAQDRILLLLLLHCMFAAQTTWRTPYPSYSFLRVRNLLWPLPSNGLCLESHYLAMALHAPICREKK